MRVQHRRPVVCCAVLCCTRCDLGAGCVGSNCLLGGDWTLKISDFGMSTLLPDSAIAEVGGIGALKYFAPECLQVPHVFSPKSDVYAFGVLLWEVRLRD